MTAPRRKPEPNPTARRSAVREEAQARGLVDFEASGPKRGAWLPGTTAAQKANPAQQWRYFSRRQIDNMRELSRPLEFPNEHDTRAFRRFAGRLNMREDRAASDPRLLAALTILRLDGEIGKRTHYRPRTQAEAKRFVWALKQIHGARHGSLSDVNAYLDRTPYATMRKSG